MLVLYIYFLLMYNILTYLGWKLLWQALNTVMICN